MQLPGLSGKRLLLVCDLKLAGGTQTYFEQLLDFYSREDVEVTLLFSPIVTKPRLAEKTAAFRTIFSHSEVHELYGDMETQSGIFTRVFRELKYYKLRKVCQDKIMEHDFDLVIVSTGRLGYGIESLVSQINSLYFVHTYPHSRLSKMLAKHVYRRRLPINTQIVSVSNYASTEIGKSLNFCRSGISVPFIYSTAGLLVEAAESTAKIKSNTVLILGALESYKNPMFVVELAKYSKNVSGANDLQFIWAGSGSLLNEMRRITSELNLDNLHFIGEQENAESLFHDCFVYLQPSLVESLGLATLDAMRNGIPCIVSNVGGLPEVVEDGISGCVLSSWEFVEWLERIIQIRDDATIGASLQAGAILNYVLKFSPDRWESRIRQLHIDALKVGHL